MPQKRRILHRIPLILADMVGLYLSLLLIVWLITGERFFFVNIFVSLMPGVYYLIPIVLVIALWQRSLRTLAFAILPILAFTILYIPAFLPRTISQAEGTPLALLTYNLRASNTNTEALNTILVNADADIVSLQEVSIEIADWAESQWIEQYPYQIRFTVDDETPEYANELNLMVSDISQYAGRMTLSRYPITDYETVLTSVGTVLYIRAEIDINGRNLTVYNVHLPPPLPINVFSTELRHQGLVELLDSVQSEDVILMGDFNMSEQSQDYKRVSGRYIDVFASVQTGLGTTWANGNNLSPMLFFIPSIIRIDYMFVSESIIPQSAQAIRDGVSDHYPLYTELILK
jgi:endonuclease/exonuclease/phosphatase family metal-dependent hydrolase